MTTTPIFVTGTQYRLTGRVTNILAGDPRLLVLDEPTIDLDFCSGRLEIYSLDSRFIGQRCFPTSRVRLADAPDFYCARVRSWLRQALTLLEHIGTADASSLPYPPWEATRPGSDIPRVLCRWHHDDLDENRRPRM